MNLLSYWFCKNSRKSGISKKNYRHHGKKNRCNCADNLSFCLKPFCLKYVKFDKINPKLFSFIDKAINANDTHRFIIVLTRVFFIFNILNIQYYMLSKTLLIMKSLLVLLMRSLLVLLMKFLLVLLMKSLLVLHCSNVQTCNWL